MASNGVSQVAIDQHITGPALTISTACSSGAHAIGLAFHMVRSGPGLRRARRSPRSSTHPAAFSAPGTPCASSRPQPAAPFSADRDGMTLAEGAAVLTLETLPSALARNAPIFAEILGFGMSTDAHHITQPRPEGPAAAILAALADSAQTLALTHQPGRCPIPSSKKSPTSTPTAPPPRPTTTVETAALYAVFGPRAAHIPISSTKGFHGHSLGASSAIEALITVLALHHPQPALHPRHHHARPHTRPRPSSSTPPAPSLPPVPS